MALRSRTNLILDEIVARLKASEVLASEISGVEDLPDLKVDTTFRLPSKTDYTENQDFADADFQVQIIRELFDKVSDHEVTVDGSDGSSRSVINSYRITSMVRIVYYHLNLSENVDNSQHDAWNVSGYMSTLIDSMDMESVSTNIENPLGELDYFVESIELNQRMVLEMKHGNSPDSIPIEHLFTIVYYSGGELSVLETPPD